MGHKICSFTVDIPCLVSSATLDIPTNDLFFIFLIHGIAAWSQAAETHETHLNSSHTKALIVCFIYFYRILALLMQIFYNLYQWHMTLHDITSGVAFLNTLSL